MDELKSKGVAIESAGLIGVEDGHEGHEFLVLEHGAGSPASSIGRGSGQ
jgi:hypothetical protein